MQIAQSEKLPAMTNRLLAPEAADEFHTQRKILTGSGALGALGWRARGNDC